MIVKEYPDGKMSKYIANLKVGDTLEMKGPIPKYNWDQGKVDNVGMVCGGTGITPMVSIPKNFDSMSEKIKKKGSDNKKKGDIRKLLIIIIIIIIITLIIIFIASSHSQGLR